MSQVLKIYAINCTGEKYTSAHTTWNANIVIIAYTRRGYWPRVMISFSNFGDWIWCSNEEMKLYADINIDYKAAWYTKIDWTWNMTYFCLQSHWLKNSMWWTYCWKFWNVLQIESSKNWELCCIGILAFSLYSSKMIYLPKIDFLNTMSSEVCFVPSLWDRVIVSHLTTSDISIAQDRSDEVALLSAVRHKALI